MDKRMDFIARGAKYLLVALPFLSSSSVFAADWNNGGTADWGTATNWTPNDVPDTVSENAIFNAPATVQPTISVDTVVGGIDFQAAATNYVITAEAALAINGGISNSSTLVQTLLLGAGGSLNLYGGGIGPSVIINNTVGRPISLHNNAGDLSQATIINNGQLVMESDVTRDTTFRIGSLSSTNANGYMTVRGKSVALGALNHDDLFSGVIYQAADHVTDLIKEGAGRLTLTANAWYTGGTYVNAGTLQIGAGGADGSLVNTSHFTVNDGATLEFNNGNTKFYYANIDGAGDLVKTGAGVLGLFQPVSLSGTIYVNDGRLRLQQQGVVTQANIENNATVEFWPDWKTMVYSGVISGSGSVSKNSRNHSLILTGDNTYTGDTIIGAAMGAIQIGDGGTHGSIVSNVQVGTGSFIEFNRADDITYNGVISGSGLLEQSGQGTLTLTQDQTFTGTTVINTGSTLQLGNGGTSGNVAGNINNKGALIFNRSDDFTYEGGIFYNNGIVTKYGAGTLTLARNGNTAQKFLVKRGALRIGDGSAGSLAADIDMDSGTSVIFDRPANLNYVYGLNGDGALIKRNSNDLNLLVDVNYTGNTEVEGGRLILGNSASSIAFASPQVNLASPDTMLVFKALGMTTYAGRITGSGGVEINPARSIDGVTLTGNSDYTGQTTVVQGDFFIGNGGYSGSIVSDIYFASGATRLTFNRADDSIYPGVMQGNGGRVEKLGAGLLQLTGENTASAPLLVYEGTVEIGNGTSGSYAGRIYAQQADATVIIDRDDDVTYAELIAGPGHFIKRGVGKTTVLNTLSTSAGVTIEEGTLSIGDGTTGAYLSAPVDNHGTLIFNRNADAAYHYRISGPGHVIQTGPSRLIFATDQSYTGGTEIAASSTLQFNGAIQGDIVNNGDVYFAQGDEYVFDGVVSGSGRLTRLGGGLSSLILTGNNTYTGGTVVEDSILQIGNNATTGSIIGDVSLDIRGVLSFARSDQYTFDGLISGEGQVWQKGDGTTILNAASNYSGLTTVLQGSLLIGDAMHSDTASILGDVDVDPKGRLGGFGTIGGNVTNRGTVAPGASVGKLTILGNYTQQDNGNFEVDIAGTESDHLDVSGTATLAGNLTLVVDPVSGFVPGHPYTIIDAGEGIVGQFANVNGAGQLNQNFLTAQVTYDNDNHQVLVGPGFRESAFLGAARTPNQRAMARYLLRSGGTPSTQAFIGSLTSNSGFADAMDDLGAASYANEQEQLGMTARWFQSQLSDRMDFYVDSEAYEQSRMWITPYGSSASIDDSNNASGFDTNMGGLALGADFPIAHRGKLGFGLAATYFSGDSSGDESVSDDGMLYQAGIYGTYHINGVTLGGSVEFGGASNVDSTRTTADGASMNGNYSATIFSQHVKASYNVDFKQNAHIRPFIGLVNQKVDRDAFDETGLDTAHTLSIDQQDYDSLKSEIGVATQAALGANMTFVGSIAWQHEFNDDQAQVTGQLLGTTDSEDTYTVSGAALGRESAVVKAGVVLVHKQKLNLTALYEGVFADAYSENGGKLQLDFDLS